ncbi:hypothetical protein SAMN04488021_101343 [Paracoccus aminovorans]|uniref:Transposase n=1 Tax=Paracoccus aminovorans TaxID=34004 RepID=A0A1I2XI01_9RHOB|nr:hypothetical protein JCM7685_1188 [Paracoccus aminovorans]SFH13113.1 hypothetical protein SAMN04488021_101343 [Paracoccus aminovorans]
MGKGHRRHVSPAPETLRFFRSAGQESEWIRATVLLYGLLQRHIAHPAMSRMGRGFFEQHGDTSPGPLGRKSSDKTARYDRPRYERRARIEIMCGPAKRSASPLGLNHVWMAAQQVVWASFGAGAGVHPASELRSIRPDECPRGSGPDHRPAILGPSGLLFVSMPSSHIVLAAPFGFYLPTPHAKPHPFLRLAQTCRAVRFANARTATLSSFLVCTRAGHSSPGSERLRMEVLTPR